MALLVFDTYDFIKELSSSGIEQGQAEAIAKGLRKIDLNHVATKEDLIEVKAAMKLDSAELKTLTRTELADTKAELLKWMFAIALGQLGILVAIGQLFWNR